MTDGQTRTHTHSQTHTLKLSTSPSPPNRSKQQSQWCHHALPPGPSLPPPLLPPGRRGSSPCRAQPQPWTQPPAQPQQQPQPWTQPQQQPQHWTRPPLPSSPQPRPQPRPQSQGGPRGEGAVQAGLPSILGLSSVPGGPQEGAALAGTDRGGSFISGVCVCVYVCVEQVWFKLRNRACGKCCQS